MRTIIRLTSIVLVVLLAAGIWTIYKSKSYYPTHPVPSMTKAELLSAVLSGNEGELIRLTESDGEEWYAYRGDQTEGTRKMIDIMKDQHWEFKEQLGGAYIFQSNCKKDAVVESEMWTSKYRLYQVPTVTGQCL